MTDHAGLRTIPGASTPDDTAARFIFDIPSRIARGLPLLIAAGFASLMFDLPTMALACGVFALAAWATAMARGPRPGWRVAMCVGGGLVAMYMWWPAESDSWAAIGLMWIGAVLVLCATLCALVVKRHPGRFPAH
jgi:hypothetical protein